MGYDSNSNYRFTVVHDAPSATTDYQGKLPQYISAINSFAVLSFTAFLALALVVRAVFFQDVPVLLVIFCCIHALMTAVINVELQKQMMLVEYVKRTLLLALPSLIAALLGIVVIYLYPSTDYWGRIATNVLVFSLFGSVILVHYFKKGKTFYDRTIWKYSFTLAAPLVFHGLAINVLSSFDRTMLITLRSTAETGVYSVAATIGTAVLVITSSAESVWIPFFTNNMNKGDKHTINSIGKKYLSVVTILCITAMLCLPEILKIFSERSYWEGINIIPPIVLATFVTVLYSLSVDVEYYYKSTKIIAINTVIAAVLNIILNAVFIPSYGAIAAAYTTVASYAVSFGIHYVTARRLDKELFEFQMYIIPIVIAVAGTVATSILIDLWVARWIIAFVLGIVMLVFLLKDESIKKMLRGNKDDD